MLLPWQQGSGGHPGFPLLRGSIRLGEHRLCHHQDLTWTHTHTHTHTYSHSLWMLEVSLSAQATGWEPVNIWHFRDKWTSYEPGAGSCQEKLLCSVVDDSVHQKCSACIHKWSSLKTELKTHYFSIMSCVVLALICNPPILCGGNITPSCILKPGTLLLPCLSAKAHTRQNVI